MDYDNPATPAAWPRATAAQRNTVKMAEEALSGLSGDVLVNVAYTILADHPGLTAEQLESLANRLGRVAHERARS